MKVVGLTGGSGAGKSVVASEFERLGAGIVDADAIYRTLCSTNQDMLKKIAKSFGDVLTTQGMLNRPKLAQIVFSDKQALEQLNQITFPYISEKSKQEFERLEQEHHPIVIYDAPTLFQAGADVLCDTVIGVLAKREIRISRIMQRDAITEHAAMARIDAQPNDVFYYTRCQYIVTNDVSRETLYQQIAQVWKKLLV